MKHIKIKLQLPLKKLNSDFNYGIVYFVYVLIAFNGKSNCPFGSHLLKSPNPMDK